MVTGAETAGFSRLTNSPTIRQFQLRLPRIKTCRLPSPPCSPRFYLREPCGDAAAERSAAPAGGGGCGDAFRDVRRQLVVVCDAAVQEILVREMEDKVIGGRCINSSPENARARKEGAGAAAKIVGFDLNENGQQPMSLGPARTVSSSFDRRLRDLPIPIRWWLTDACRTAIQELVADVEKEIMSSSGAALLLEDVRVWEDVIAAAEAVGMEVTEIRQKLTGQIPRPNFEPAWPRSKNPAAAPDHGDGSFEGRFRDLAPPIPWRLVAACRSIMRELVAAVEEEVKNAAAGEALPEDVSVWTDVVTAAEMVGLGVDGIKSRAAAAARRRHQTAGGLPSFSPAPPPQHIYK